MIETDKKEAGICVVRPDGDRLTAANATAFRTDVFALIEGGHDRLVIDFGNIMFIDSSGLGAMVGLLKKIGNRGEVVVCGLADNVRQMFRITRMDRVFSAHADVETATRALQDRG